MITLLVDSRFVLISDEDWDLSLYHWYLNNNKQYAARKLNGKHVLMHLIIAKRMNLNTEIFIDHKDRNKLNNQRENLRSANYIESARNRTKLKGTKSKYIGVSWKEDIKQWQATIEVQNKKIYLGVHHLEEHAAIAYNVAAERLFGEFAVLNEIK